VSMNAILIRLGAIGIGYVFGCFLTACVVARVDTGKSVREIGTGNPGMANIMDQLGFTAGLIVIFGDILKTVLSALLALVLFPELSRTAILYAGLGAVLGHNYPFWRKFSGGKGVAVTCTALILYAPFVGTASDLIGMLVVFFTGFLGLGSIVITTAFLIASFFCYGTESVILALALEVLMILKHYPSLVKIARGEEKIVLKLFGKKGKKS